MTTNISSFLHSAGERIHLVIRTGMGCSSSQVSLPPEPLRSKDGGSDIRTTDIVDWDFLQDKMGQNKEGMGKLSPAESRKMSNSDSVLSQKRESDDTKHSEHFKVIKQEDKSQRKLKSKQRLNPIATQMTLQEVDEIE